MNLKKIVSSAAAAALLFSSVSAYAEKISITIDGEQFIPRNALGQEVEPFIENGTTYLPVRAISGAFGKEVYFDAEKNSVYVGKLPSSSDADEHPALKIGDRVLFEGEIVSACSASDYAGMDRVMCFAEENFTDEDIALAVDEVRADMEDWMKNGLSEEDILSGSPYGTLEKAYYYEACLRLARSYAKERIDESVYGEYVTVRHILVETKDDADEVLKKLSEGSSFEELTEEYNTDPGQSETSSYTFTYGQMVEEFETAAFGLSEGEYTKEAVKSDYGYHIIERLPLDKSAVSTDSLADEILYNILPEARKVTVAATDGEYYGEIDGVKISKKVLQLFDGNENFHNEIFFYSVVTRALYNAYIESGIVTQEEINAAREEYDPYAEEIEANGFDISEEDYAFYADMEILFYVVNSKEDPGEPDSEQVYKLMDELDYEIYRDVRVFIDGNVIVPSDADGNYAAPKNVDGTVYVPLRAIAEALGMNAGWNNEAREVVITR